MNTLEKLAIRPALQRLKTIKPNSDAVHDVQHYLATKGDKPFSLEEAQVLSERVTDDFEELENLRAECIQLLEALLQN
tara:strand:- start:15775 stop:16008 length:234 start_codon:yes stop_codon:yes gene_type:complete